MTADISSSTQKYPTKVWESLSKRCLPARDPDSNYWWNLTGYHLANMVEGAGYSIDRQYDALLFHYHWICPRLGPAPSADGHINYKSITGIEGSPMEYSWKWNTSKGEPDIRYSWEAVNNLSGTARDPLNLSATLEYIHAVKEVVPEADFTWVHHFLGDLFDHDIARYAKEAEESKLNMTTTMMHAVEFVRSGVGLKSYFVPRKLGHHYHLTLDEWDEAIRKLDPTNPGRGTMMEFARNNPIGKSMMPILLAMDDTEPVNSRLKLYFTTPNTSFKSVREIMTVGGIVDIPEEKMQDLRNLILTVLGLPEDYSEDEEVPVNDMRPESERYTENEALTKGFVYFFDVAPGRAEAVIPEVKLYVPVRKFGPNDRQIAENLMGAMKARGRGDYCDGYMRMIESIAEHRGLENGKGLHTYLSYLFNKKGGEPDIKSYICPEAYHAARFAPAKQ